MARPLAVSLAFGSRSDIGKWGLGCLVNGMDFRNIRLGAPNMPTMHRVFSSPISWLFVGGATAVGMNVNGPFLAATSNPDDPFSGKTMHFFPAMLEWAFPGTPAVSGSFPNDTPDWLASGPTPTGITAVFWGGSNLFRHTALLGDLSTLTSAHVILGFSGATDARKIGLALINETNGKPDGGGFFKELSGKVDDHDRIRDAWLRVGAAYGRRQDGGWSDHGFRALHSGIIWRPDRNGRPVKGRTI